MSTTNSFGTVISGRQ
ncbi:hypothetical protein ACUOA5_43425, partial [Escherichia coli]